HEYPHEFSGGMRQRVMIAMALACNPRIVIADEPVTALDVMIQAQILELLERLKRELDLSMILISHDLSVMAETCDSMAIMYAGKIVERGSVRDVYKNSKHPYTKDLIGAFPDIEGPQTLPAYIPGLLPSLINPPVGCRFHPRCKYAWPLCVDQEPGLDPVGEGHLAACHLNTTTPPRKEAA
ncbi:MAG: ABC transporter ATP-binding protein, partial [Methanobacteriota archaeon]